MARVNSTWSADLLENTHIQELLQAIIEEPLRINPLQLVQRSQHDLANGVRGGVGIAVGPSQGFGQNFVYDTELRDFLGSDLHRLGRLRGLGLVFPQDGCAALRADHRIDRVLEHIHPIPHCDAQSAT